MASAAVVKELFVSPPGAALLDGREVARDTQGGRPAPLPLETAGGRAAAVLWRRGMERACFLRGRGQPGGEDGGGGVVST